jgi:hypothetical protein
MFGDRTFAISNACSFLEVFTMANILLVQWVYWSV